MQQQGPGVIPQAPQQPGPGTPQQAQQMQPQIQQQAQEKLDNISKVKSLIGPLRESLAVSLFNNIKRVKHEIMNLQTRKSTSPISSLFPCLLSVDIKNSCPDSPPE